MLRRAHTRSGYARESTSGLVSPAHAPAPAMSAAPPARPARFVVTGVAGFIGSTLARELCDAGHTVLGVDNFVCGYDANLAWVDPARHAFTLIRGSAGDAAAGAALAAGDVVVHLGAISALASNQEDPRASYEVNVASTAGLLESCRRAGVAHVVYASTSAIYENTPEVPTSEAHAVRPNLIYSLGKKHCEELVRSFHEVYGLPYTSLRFFNVFGPHQDGLRTHPCVRGAGVCRVGGGGCGVCVCLVVVAGAGWRPQSTRVLLRRRRRRRQRQRRLFPNSLARLLAPFTLHPVRPCLRRRSAARAAAPSSRT